MPRVSQQEQRGFVSTEFTVHCGGCFEWDRTSAVAKRKAMVAWKGAGWRFTKPRGWLCPACVKAAS